MAKTGYLEPEEIDHKLSNAVSVNEQETHISYMRDEKTAEIYTSDTTQMTRLDKLCKNNPDTYSLIADTGRGKTYLCKDKSLISFRSKKREFTDEQKTAASDRFKKLRADGKL